MKLLTKEQQESYENPKICYICKKKFENKYFKGKRYCKVREHCHHTWKYRGAAHSTYNLKYSVSKRTFINDYILINESNYDFIIKALAEEFKRKFTCLAELNEKHITFTVPIEKEVTRTDKNGEEIERNTSYI